MPRIRLALVALVVALVLVVAGCSAFGSGGASGSGSAGPKEAPGSPAALGQQIFTTGNGAGGSPVATSSGAGGPCARCHGSDATGKIGPDIRWAVLTGNAASNHAPRFPLKTEGEFTQAVTQGNAAGNSLRPMMPHYNLSSDETAGLIAYLKSL